MSVELPYAWGVVVLNRDLALLSRLANLCQLAAQMFVQEYAIPFSSSDKQLGLVGFLARPQFGSGLLSACQVVPTPLWCSSTSRVDGIRADLRGLVSCVSPFLQFSLRILGLACSMQLDNYPGCKSGGMVVLRLHATFGRWAVA